MKRPSLINPASQRGFAMKQAALREQGLAAGYSKLPGFRSARITRAYSVKEMAQGLGMTADMLREATRGNQLHVPVWVRHSASVPPAGRTLSAYYNDDDQFLYARTLLNLGDGSSGDYVHAEQQKGNLRYMSATFTVPEPDDPHPERFQSRLREISFVDEPHEPYAEVLVAHSTSESQKPIRTITLCSPASPMASTDSSGSAAAAAKVDEAAETAAGNKRSTGAAPPSFGGLTAEQIKKVLDENARLTAANESAAAQLAYFQQRHQSSMAPIVSEFEKALSEEDKLDDDERKLVMTYIQEAANDHATAPVAQYFHRLLTSRSAARDELKKFHDSQAEAGEQHNELSKLLQQQLGGANHSSVPSYLPTPAAARQLAGGVQPPVNTPMVVSHSKSGAVPHRADGAPSSLAAKFHARLQQHRDEMNGRVPDTKRAKAQV